ncbi:MAG: hypothetical protein IPO07_15540 [Haliscomenobacter sp.]|nr:hypothetical protein [Haliscomenobacter sp.]MBK9490023.1 hypothetical protein [Haliscomenobacter sp.]
MQLFLHLLTLLLFVGNLAQAETRTVEFIFYTEKIRINFNTDILQVVKPSIEGKSIKNHYLSLQRTTHQSLLTDLKLQREAFALNDWLYAELVRGAVDQILSGRSNAEKNLLIWFCLSESGFDTRVTFRDQRVFVCVFTKDEIYEAPLIEDRGRTFVNLSAIAQIKADEEGVFLLDFAAKPNGRAFSFHLGTFPGIKPLLEKKTLNFRFKEQQFPLEVNFDRNWVRIMERHPLIDEREYLKAPMSEVLRSSLLPQLTELIKGRSSTEALELITAFTRSCFKYKEDKEFFGRSKPMIPDEVFHYPYSDCEDRSALYYALVKELLGWPMLIIGFPDHLTIAVSIPDFDGDAIEYQGRKYYFCDPTGPANSHEIGRLPEEFIGQEYEILGQFN